MTTRLVPRIGFVAAAVLSFAVTSMAQPSRGRQIGGIGITVFRDENFRGQSATFRQDIPDLRQLGLNDRISARIDAGASTSRLMASYCASFCVSPGSKWFRPYRLNVFTFSNAVAGSGCPASAAATKASPRVTVENLR